MINHKIRKAIKEDVKDILRLLIELAIFEKEPDAVKITEEEIPVSGLLGAFGGCCGICGALFLLIVGGVMALTLKDQPKVQTSIQFDNDLVVVNENSEVPEYDQDDST